MTSSINYGHEPEQEVRMQDLRVLAIQVQSLRAEVEHLRRRDRLRTNMEVLAHPGYQMTTDDLRAEVRKDGTLRNPDQ